MKKSKLAIAALAAGAIAMASNPLFAAFSGSPVTATLNVQANVVARCSLTPAGTLDFGDVDPLAAVAYNAAAQFSIACTPGTSAVVTMDNIINMTNGGSTLTYTLGQVANGASWGSLTYTATSANPTAYTVHGTMPASQPLATAIGIHSGTAQITATF